MAEELAGSAQPVGACDADQVLRRAFEIIVDNNIIKFRHMNVVMTGSGGIVEVQGTAEGEPFTRGQMETMMTLADRGIRELFAAQRAALSK